jgi:hypothetical protein
MEHRQDKAEDAARQLISIPLSPTSDGGVTAARAGGGPTTTIHIANVSLPGVRDPLSFITTMEDLERMNNVAAARR